MANKKDFTVIQLGRRNDYQVAISLQENARLAKLITDYWTPPYLKQIASISKRLRIDSQICEKLILRNRCEIPDNKVDSLMSLSEIRKFKKHSFYEYSSMFFEKAKKHIKGDYIYALSEANGLFEHINDKKKIIEIVLSAQNDYEQEIRLLNQYKNLAYNNSIQRKKDAILMENESIRYCDEIIVPSVFLRDILQENTIAASKPIHVIPYWCPNCFDQKSPKVTRFKKGEKLELLFVGRISLIKGIGSLVEIMNELKNEPIHLTIAGQLTIPINLQDYPNITFVGRQSKEGLNNLYRQSHALVFPTSNEGSSLVSYESIAYGLPLITTKACGSIAEHNKHGIIIESAKASDVIQAIKLILSTPSCIEQMSRNCIELAKKQTSLDYRNRVYDTLSKL